MAEESTVILAQGGTDERIIFANSIEIKDLWHICMDIRSGASKKWDEEERERNYKEILEVWHLAHNLKRHIIENT